MLQRNVIAAIHYSLSKAALIDLATCEAKIFEPCGLKWTLAFNWILASCGWAKAYKSSIATPFAAKVKGGRFVYR